MDWQKLHNKSTPEERVDILFHMLYIIERRKNRLPLIKRFIHRPRARIHWIGGRRQPRLERALAFVLIFGAMFVLEFEEYLLWCIMWGGGLSIFINLHLIYRLILRKRYDWIG